MLILRIEKTKSISVILFMEEILFTKMHGIGNDYIYIDCMNGCPANLPQLSIEMSDRHCGVGGDGIILILPSEIADFKMRIFNADGSEAKMCGNGSRCVGKYVFDYGLTDKRLITLETLSGIKTLSLHVRDGKVATVTVDMGEPVIDAELIPVSCSSAQMVEQPIHTTFGTYAITAVSMGNPHGVVFVDDLSKIDVHRLGRELELNPIWPDRANIEFAQIIDKGKIKMRVWERGSGETMACGTGACATAVAAAITDRCGHNATIELLGGTLDIEWGDDGHIYMTGPAATVFEGRYIRKS